MLVNKSHSTAYAIIACRTAYYKYKYPAVFFAATLNFQDDPNKQKNILREAIETLTFESPRLSHYSYRFKGSGTTVQYGLCGVKGFGKSLQGVEIKSAKNLYEFCILNPQLPKDILTTLIKIGFFDEWGYTRQGLLSVLPLCLDEVSAQSQDEIEENSDFYAVSVLPLLNKQENYISNQTNEEYFECLQWENEFLNAGINTDKGNKILLSNKSKSYDGKQGWCNFVVLSCSEQKKTRAGNPYYETVLMDVKGNLITRRFDQPINQACIRAYVQEDDKKHFVTKCKEYPWKPLQVKKYNLDEAGLPEHIKQHPALYQKVLHTSYSDSHNVQLTSDATGKQYFIPESFFNKWMESGFIYEADFKKLVASVAAM